MQFRPCIDIHNGKVKQIVGSSLRDEGNLAKENYVSGQDAGYYAGLYRDRGLKGGHVILLNAVDSPFYEETRRQAMLALRAYPGGLQVGGGITPAAAEAFLSAGASHVIVTSYVFREGRIDYVRLRELAAAVGRERLVLDLSCRRRPENHRYPGWSGQGDPGTEEHTVGTGGELGQTTGTGGELGQTTGTGGGLGQTTGTGGGLGQTTGTGGGLGQTTGTGGGLGQTTSTGGEENQKEAYYVVTDRWQTFTDEKVDGQLMDRLSEYCAEFLVHAVDVEGKSQGIEEPLAVMLGSWGKLPVTYAGGVRSLDDIHRLNQLGQGRLNVTIGSALDLFGGSLSFEDVVRICS